MNICSAREPDLGLAIGLELVEVVGQPVQRLALCLRLVVQALQHLQSGPCEYTRTCSACIRMHIRKAVERLALCLRLVVQALEHLRCEDPRLNTSEFPNELNTDMRSASGLCGRVHFLFLMWWGCGVASCALPPSCCSALAAPAAGFRRQASIARNPPFVHVHTHGHPRSA